MFLFRLGASPKGDSAEKGHGSSKPKLSICPWRARASSAWIPCVTVHSCRGEGKRSSCTAVHWIGDDASTMPSTLQETENTIALASP